MQEALYLIWKVIMYNQLNIGDVQTTCCDVCSHKHGKLVISESLKDLLSRPL